MVCFIKKVNIRDQFLKNSDALLFKTARNNKMRVQIHIFFNLLRLTRIRLQILEYMITLNKISVLNV